jgi:anti-sigma regulatory factor (Ser/Thr protein kinase)
VVRYERENMILQLSLSLPDDQSYIRTTRLLSRTLIEDIQVIKADIDDVETIVGELCSNVVRHACLKSLHYKVVLEFYEPRVVITVSDEGRGFDVEDVSEIGAPRRGLDGSERLGGFGLLLLEGLSDKIDFTETDLHGTTVRVEKKLHYQTQAAADEAADIDKSTGSLALVGMN